MLYVIQTGVWSVSVRTGLGSLEEIVETKIGSCLSGLSWTLAAFGGGKPSFNLGVMFH